MGWHGVVRWWRSSLSRSPLRDKTYIANLQAITLIPPHFAVVQGALLSRYAVQGRQVSVKAE